MAQKIITDFVKSVDEHVYPQYDLFIKQFEYTNGYKNASFTEARVDFKKMLTPFCVHIKEIFKNGLHYLQQYSEHGIDGVPEDIKEILECLINFLENKDRHLRCLVPFMDDDKEKTIPNRMREPTYTFLLAEHLFSPLIPGHAYYLDRNHFPNELVSCPGKCGITCIDHLDKPTGIGNENVWHGFADIWIDKRVPVSVVLEEVEESEETDAPSKRTKLEKDDLVIEVKQPKEKLKVPNTVAQTVAQSIVNSFLQSKSGIVPTLCTSFGYLMIYMYDSENDIFLMSSTESPLKLFSESTKNFVDNHVIYLWMLLNYATCEKKPTEKFVQYCKKNNLLSGFPEQVKDKIHIYRKCLNQNLSSFPRVKEEKETEIAPHRLPYN